MDEVHSILCLCHPCTMCRVARERDANYRCKRCPSCAAETGKKEKAGPKGAAMGKKSRQQRNNKKEQQRQRNERHSTPTQKEIDRRESQLSLYFYRGRKGKRRQPPPPPPSVHIMSGNLSGTEIRRLRAALDAGTLTFNQFRPSNMDAWPKEDDHGN